ncbi:MAG: PfkB family carbohydrate kinase [Thaumarchaeota archaeon]|nr:MAG: Ribokinase [Nitrosopumilales archaeon]MCZ6582454.1 PfkB family carbohydrate kinase [Nitrososphaerota archaeon]GFN40076.1 MAG: ribokinase [Marine Group I thaumarchaeote]
MLTVFGSVALDTIRTPQKVLKNSLGGAATFAAISSSFFVKPGLIAVVGNDFPRKYYSILERFINLRGLVIEKGKTFRYDGSYDKTLTYRTTNKTELNVLGAFKPSIPKEYRKSRFVYLANNDPVQNTKLIQEFENVKFSMCDTIEFWITNKKQDVIKMIKSVDAVVINDEEAKLLTKENNLLKCAKKMMGWGSKYVIIKKGEHGSLLFYEDLIFPSPGFSLENIVDPTGAGDSFAGAMIGYLANQGKTKLSTIREAVVYGNIMGSFAVENYGIRGLTNLNKSQIQKRFNQYKKMIRF